ncbi:hypothetical protein Cni_G19724 [Canna indica]|uniref:Uncharacterized protein n=1 Tax=Canna indica TaxID=4628 RepID=A0AAQ3QH67_9LILI|nr:hypothetical protein Cni_G19724 [Canna indica]
MAYKRAAFKLHDDDTQLNFPELRHDRAHMGPPLQPSVDAKLQAICETLSNPQESGPSPSQYKCQLPPTRSNCVRAAFVCPIRFSSWCSDGLMDTDPDAEML